MKRVFIIHGWDGDTHKGWIPWLKDQLESKGFEVVTPNMPEAGAPRIYNWVPTIEKKVGRPDKNTYLIGHSMGNQAVVRYLETLGQGETVGGAVFVAGFLKRLSNLEEDAETQETAKHWLDAKIDLQKVKSHLPKSVAIFSDNDMYVPLDNREEFENVLGSKIIVEENQAHYDFGSGVLKVPTVLKEILEMAGVK